MPIKKETRLVTTATCDRCRSDFSEMIVQENHALVIEDLCYEADAGSEGQKISGLCLCQHCTKEFFTFLHKYKEQTQ